MYCAASQEEVLHFVRQWGSTLAWNAELPLPLPLQFDETPGGCRLGFVRVNNGAVQLVRRAVAALKQCTTCENGPCF